PREVREEPRHDASELALKVAHVVRFEVRDGLLQGEPLHAREYRRAPGSGPSLRWRAAFAAWWPSVFAGSRNPRTWWHHWIQYVAASLVDRAHRSAPHLSACSGEHGSFSTL